MSKSIYLHKKLNFFDYISISNLNTAIGTFTLSLTFLYLNLGILSYLGALIPAILVFANYTFDNISGISEEDIVNKPKRYTFKKLYGKFCIILASILLLTAAFYSFIHSLTLGLAVLLPELSVVLYAVNLEKYGIPRIKKILLVKNVYTALIWIFVVIIIPLIYLNRSINSQVVAVMIQLFIALLINTVVCDINDIKGDIENGVKTVPTVIGRKNTLNFCIAANIFIIICSLLFFSKYTLSIGVLPFFATNLFSFTYLLYYYFKRDAKIRNEFVDLVLIIPFIVMIFQIISALFC